MSSGGGGSRSNSSSTTRTEVINPALANAAQAVGTQQFEAYTGPRVAAPSATQTAGANAIRSNATAQAWRPGMDNATSMATSGARATDIPGLLAMVAQLQNPYEDGVVKATLGDMQTELDRNLTNQRLRSGGSESGIRQLFAENEMTKSGLSAIGRTAGELRSAGFDKAMSGAIGIDSANRTRALSGATTLADLTARTAALQSGDASALYNLGRDETAREQAIIDGDLEEFARRQGWNAQQLAAWAEAFQAATGTRTDSTSTSRTSNGIGGLMQGIGALSGFRT